MLKKSCLLFVLLSFSIGIIASDDDSSSAKAALRVCNDAGCESIDIPTQIIANFEKLEEQAKKGEDLGITVDSGITLTDFENLVAIIKNHEDLSKYDFRQLFNVLYLVDHLKIKIALDAKIFEKADDSLNEHEVMLLANRKLVSDMIDRVQSLVTFDLLNDISNFNFDHISTLLNVRILPSNQELNRVHKIYYNPKSGLEYWVIFFGGRAVLYNALKKDPILELYNVRGIYWNPNGLGYWMIDNSFPVASYYLNNEKIIEINDVASVYWRPDGLGCILTSQKEGLGIKYYSAQRDGSLIGSGNLIKILAAGFDGIGSNLKRVFWFYNGEDLLVEYIDHLVSLFKLEILDEHPTTLKVDLKKELIYSTPSGETNNLYNIKLLALQPLGSKFWSVNYDGLANYYDISKDKKEMIKSLEGVDSIYWHPKGFGYWILFKNKEAKYFNIDNLDIAKAELSNVRNISWNPNGMGYLVLFPEGIKYFNNLKDNTPKTINGTFLFEYLYWQPQGLGYWIEELGGKPTKFQELVRFSFKEKLLINKIVNQFLSTHELVDLKEDFLKKESAIIENLKKIGVLDLLVSSKILNYKTVPASTSVVDKSKKKRSKKTAVAGAPLAGAGGPEKPAVSVVSQEPMAVVAAASILTSVSPAKPAVADSSLAGADSSVKPAVSPDKPEEPDKKPKNKKKKKKK